MTTEIIIISLCLIVIIVAIIAAIIKVHKKHVTKNINANSIRLKALNEINQKFHFQSLISEYAYSYTCKNKGQYDIFKPDSYLKIIISENPSIPNAYERAEDNKLVYEHYGTELNKIPKTEYCKKLWIKTENTLFEAAALHPITSFSIKIFWQYSSPKGRNYYSDQHIYQFDEISKFINEVNEEKKERNTRQAKIKRERALMTDSLRYEILKRDNYKCQICGSTAADGVKLEIDHIIPVSKGGKTVPENLRVLCDRCNRGKSNKL